MDSGRSLIPVPAGKYVRGKILRPASFDAVLSNNTSRHKILDIIENSAQGAGRRRRTLP